MLFNTFNAFTSCAITGSPQELWQLHHVSLDAKMKFRVVFEGTKVEAGPPSGGQSLDDINVSETTCPEFIWRVKNFSHVMENTPINTPIFSPLFTSKEGYTFQMMLYPSGREGYQGQLSAYAHLVARERGHRTDMAMSLETDNHDANGPASTYSKAHVQPAQHHH